MFGDMKEKQAEIAAKLKETKLETQLENGALIIKANANREIEDIQIDKSLISDADQLEDLLVAGINQILEKMKNAELEQTQKMMSSLLPGFGGLSDLFK